MARLDTALRFVCAMIRQTIALAALLAGAALIIGGSIAAARGLGWSEDTGGFIGVAALLVLVSGLIGAAERADGDA